MRFIILLLSLLNLLQNSRSQSIAVGDTIFDSLDALGCAQFKRLIQNGQLEQKYKSAQPLTIFVFNDTTYAQYGRKLDTFFNDDTNTNFQSVKDYVQAFTLSQALETTSFSAATPYESTSALNHKLFLNRRNLRTGNVASGQPGPTRYFCNGAMVVRPNIRAREHVIHIIDHVLELPSIYNALALVSGYEPKQGQYKFFKMLMEFLSQAPQEQSTFNYESQVSKPLRGSQVTFFLPSDDALNNIPSQKLQELKSNTNLLLEILALHIIPKQVLFTSVVNHNEGFNSQYNVGRVIYRKNFNKEAVYVTGVLKGGRIVTAQITRANMTVSNGVVHEIDNILGYVFRNALEEIKYNTNTNNFDSFVESGREDLKNAISATSGVTVFVPTNNAIQAIANVYPEYQTNLTLKNRVIELSLLQPGVPFSLTNQNGGYRSLIERESRYNGRRVKIYSQGNDTWVEGGYVRARVTKPDIGVTNGLVHQVDAVFGIPTRDMVYTIFCEDRLIRTYEQMTYVGLDKYMRDPTLLANQACSFRSGESGSSAGFPNRPTDTNNYDNQYRSQCGRGVYRCEFTFFIPNGTAIDNFVRTVHGQKIMNDPVRWRWILRRLITRKVIYLDQLALGAPKLYDADNGDEVVIQVSSRSNLPSSQRTAYLFFQGVQAEIIHSDIGASNGVIHIIDSIPFVQDDIFRDVSAAATLKLSPFTFLFLLALYFLKLFVYETNSNVM